MTRVTIELRALELHGFHGVLDRERTEGQRFVFDVELTLETAAAETDALEDAVDYRAVAACIREVSDGRRFVLLEALATAVANELVRRFPVERARVTAAKPEVRLEPPVEYVAVTAEAPRRPVG
jgi:dihydroneopterin aldolase